jgi:hypothetical protein
VKNVDNENYIYRINDFNFKLQSILSMEKFMLSKCIQYIIQIKTPTALFEKQNYTNANLENLLIPFKYLSSKPVEKSI